MTVYGLMFKCLICSTSEAHPVDPASFAITAKTKISRPAKYKGRGRTRKRRTIAGKTEADRILPPLTRHARINIINRNFYFVINKRRHQRIRIKVIGILST